MSGDASDGLRYDTMIDKLPVDTETKPSSTAFPEPSAAPDLLDEPQTTPIKAESITSEKSSPELSDDPEPEFNWSVPLPETIRPKTLRDYIGQDHLLGLQGRINDFIRLRYLPSMILYGPPGVGKTTLASILAHETGYVFVELNATDGTIADLKQLLTMIEKENIKRENTSSEYLLVVVFIDEIHRFRINQQDFLLPLIEAGQFVFIGATTVNPKVKIRPAILSRCQVFELQSLSQTHLLTILNKAITYENIRRRNVFGMNFLRFSENVKLKLIEYCSGDSRKLISSIQFISVNLNRPQYKYEGEFVPVDVPLQILDLIEGFRPKLKLNTLYKMLFNMILYRPKVKIGKNKMAKAKSPALLTKISDRNDLYFHMELNKFILPSDNKKQYEYARQMEYSDNEYEAGGILSDTPLDYEDIQTKSPKFPLLQCLLLSLNILEYEDPKRFLRNILLFSLIHIKDNSLLTRIMGLVKSINTVNINTTKVFANLVEKLYKSTTITRTKTIKFKIALIRKFLKSHKAPTPLIPDAVYDQDLVNALLTPPRYTYEPVKGIEVEDIDEDVNLGTLFGEELDLLDEPLDADSVLTSVSMMDLDNDASFILMSDASE